MSTHLKILSQKEIKAFDSPPEFSGEERKRFFYLPQWAEEIVAELRTPTNKVGFVLQLGYFSAVNKFFVSLGFLQRDIESVLRRLQIAQQSIDLSKYVKGTGTRHQDLIRENLGVRPFSDAVKREVFSQAKAICAKQVKPKLIFWSLVDYLREKKIEIPTYHALSEMISEAHRHFERDLVVRIDKQISPAQSQILNQLLAIDSTYESVEKQSLKLKRYKLTLLKKISQSTRPKRILENVTDLQELKALYFELNSLIAGLDLSDEMVDYYAQVARRSQIFQLSRREEKRYLYTSASQLFRRLSSYSRQHPLYLAIKEFGRIIKTLFILEYIDGLTLRQAIEKQLNKLENSHRFGKAIFFGNNQEFQYGTVEQQLIAEGCKRLISNAIICWNYLYLTQLIANASSSQKHQIIATLKNGSPVAWRHVNLHGEYDFSEEKLKNSIEFRLPELLAVRVGENGR